MRQLIVSRQDGRSMAFIIDLYLSKNREERRRDTIKDFLDEVGLDDLKEEIKDIIEKQ